MAKAGQSLKTGAKKSTGTSKAENIFFLVKKGSSWMLWYKHELQTNFTTPWRLKCALSALKYNSVHNALNSDR